MRHMIEFSLIWTKVKVDAALAALVSSASHVQASPDASAYAQLPIPRKTLKERWLSSC